MSTPHQCQPKKSPEHAKPYEKFKRITTFVLMIRIEDLALFAFGNRSGCRFITVDAYADAVSFYENKGGFKFFTENDVNDDTRLLYFDLKPFKDALETL